MQKLFGFIAIMILSPTLQAATAGYDLQIDLSINGHHFSTPDVKVAEGETFQYRQKVNENENFIDVTATKEEGQNILLNMTVGTIAKNGERQVISRPRVITTENNPAQINIINETSEYDLTVTAQKTSL